jgi:glycine cleavage system H protein
VNESAEADGWLYKVKISDAAELDELMDAAAYQELLKELDE